MAFFLSSQKTGFYKFCKLSPLETICIKCQILFSGKHMKNVSKCRLVKILPRVLSVKGYYRYKLTLFSPSLHSKLLWMYNSRGYSELIIFPTELHSNSTLFGGEEFISGYGWASKLCFNSKTRISTVKQIRKTPLSPALSGTFWRLNVAAPQLAGIKNWSFAISPLLLLAPANTNRNIYFFETIRKLHKQVFSSNKNNEF